MLVLRNAVLVLQLVEVPWQTLPTAHGVWWGPQEGLGWHRSGQKVTACSGRGWKAAAWGEWAGSPGQPQGAQHLGCIAGPGAAPVLPPPAWTLLDSHSCPELEDLWLQRPKTTVWLWPSHVPSLAAFLICCKRGLDLLPLKIPVNHRQTVLQLSFVLYGSDSCSKVSIQQSSSYFYCHSRAWSRMYLAKVDLDLGLPAGSGQGKERGPWVGTWLTEGMPFRPSCPDTVLAIGKEEQRVIEKRIKLFPNFCPCANI